MIINDSRAKFEIYIIIAVWTAAFYSNLTLYKLIEKYRVSYVLDLTTLSASSALLILPYVVAHRYIYRIWKSGEFKFVRFIPV